MSGAKDEVKLPKIPESPRKKVQNTNRSYRHASLPQLDTLSNSLVVKQNIKLICSWYNTWRSWQRHVLLSSLTSSCSREQLNILLTSLESLHHHDFSAVLAPRVARLKENSPTHNTLKKYKKATNFDSSNDVVKASVSEEGGLTTAQYDLIDVNDRLGPYEEASVASHNPQSEDFFSFKRKGFGTTLALEYSSCLLAPNRQKKSKIHRRSKTWSNTVKPSAQQLLEHFKTQQSTLAKWLYAWDGHQKTWLLLEIVKLSNSEQLGYLAQCIHQRMLDHKGIDVLEDHLLLNIFSYLDPKSLCRASQVCRHWHRLASSEVLWREHCSVLGRQEGLDGLTEALEALGRDYHVDWKEAFRQLRGMVKRIKALVVKSASANAVESKEELPRQVDRLPSAVLRNNLSLKEMVAIVRSTSGGTSSPHHHILGLAPESAISRRRRLRFERMSLAVTSTAEVHPSGDQFEVAPPREDSLQPELHDGVPVPNTETLTKGLTILGEVPRPTLPGGIKIIEQEVPNKDTATIYGRLRKSVSLIPVIVDSRPAVPHIPEPEGIQALVLGGFLTDGETHKPGKVLSILKVRRMVTHDDAITCAMFDVRKIVTGSLDMTVRVHDMRSGREVSVLTGHKGGVRCLQYDDNILVTGSWDTTCLVWDMVQGGVVTELSGHMEGVLCLKFDHKHIVTGSQDSTVCVWHATNHHCIHHLKAHNGPVTCLVLENGEVFSGSKDGTVLIWDIETGTCLGQLAHSSPLVAVEKSKLLLVSVTVGGQIHTWNLSTQTPVMSWSLDTTGVELGTTITSMCLKDTHVIVGASDGCLYEWDLATGTCVRYLRGHSRPVTTIQSGENRLVTASSDMTVCVWYTKDCPKSCGPYFVDGEGEYFTSVPVKTVTL